MSPAGPGGPGGTPIKTLDICFDGDLSGNQYDGSCEPGLIIVSTGSTVQVMQTPVQEEEMEEKTLYSL